MNSLSWIDDKLQELNREKRLRTLRTRESPPVAASIQIDGDQFINFGSNDYLGIAADQDLVLSVQNSTSQVGVGSGASPLVNGRGTLHRRLEKELADFEGRPAALLFSSGYAANVGTICALVGKGDIVFSDSLNHASIIDGCRLSGAQIAVYPHCDIDALKRNLQASSKYRRRLIVTDGLFSMDGDLAPLPQLCQLANTFNAMLMVDEAHATGVFGSTGKGSCEHFSVAEDVDVVVGTLSKALGCAGGFVAGSSSLIQWISNTARPYIFSTAPPEPIAAAAFTALQIASSQIERRLRLSEISARLRMELAEMGFEIGNSVSQIIPIILGDNATVLEYSDRLQSDGFFVPAIRPPAVADQMSRLRLTLCSSHSDQQVDSLLYSLKKLQRLKN